MATKAQMQEEMERMRRRLEELEPNEVEEAVEAVEALDATADPGESFEEVELFLEEAGTPGSDLVVDGYRWDDEGDGKVKFVHRWALPDFDLHKVKEQFGGGRWSMRLKNAQTRKHLKAKTVVIEGPRREVDPNASSPDERTFAEKILDQQGLVLEHLQELRHGPPAAASGVDPINMALSIVGAFEGVLAPQRELVQQAMLNKGGDSPSFSEMFKVFQMGMEMGKDSTPQGSDPMGQVLAATLPGLLNVIGSGDQQPTQPGPVHENPPDNPETQMVPTGNPTRPAWDVLLQPYMPMLTKWARNDAEPNLRAAFVVDELPPEAEAILLEQVRRGKEFFGEFLILHPEIKPWEDWFANFWVAVADQFPWGEGDFGPHPFQELEELPAEELQEKPLEDQQETPGVEVGTH